MDNNLEAILESLRPLLIRVRRDITAVRKPGKPPFWTTDPLTDESMLKHLNGVQELRGVCPIHEGSSTTQVALLDMDSHKGEVPWEDMLARAIVVRDGLLAEGLKPLMFRSSGGNGIHLIMVWDQPQDAGAVRRKLRSIIMDLGYVDKAGGRGVLDDWIEVFPKQDYVPEGGNGNQFILPLGAQSRYIDPAAGLIEDNGAAAKMLVWEASKDIAPVTESLESSDAPISHPSTIDMDFEIVVAQQPLGIDRDRIIEYLKSIPCADCSYDEWVEVGAALHHETQGSADGLKLFDAWSAVDKARYKKSEVAKKWKSFGKYTGTPITMASIIKKVGGVTNVTVTLDDGSEVSGFEALKTEAATIGNFDAYQAFVKKVAGMSRNELGDDLRAQLAKPLLVAWGKAQGMTNADVRKALAHKSATKTAKKGRPKYDLDEEGRIKPGSYNTELFVATPAETGMEVGFDTFQDCIMFKRSPDDGWQRFSDEHYQELMVKAENNGFSYSDKVRVRDAVFAVAKRNEFDSAQLWLNGLDWDGVPRVEDFFTNYFNVEPSPYAKAVSRYTWTALVARILVPGIQADMTPVLVGSQGLRKSSGVKAMSPSHEFFAELSFGDKEDELARKMRGTLVVELPELKGLKSRDREHIKAWMTRRSEKWTPKYREFSISYDRRCLFIGTTNDSQFLDNDASGQRRWLPLDVGQVDVEGITKDCEQFWAEAMFMYRVDGIDYQEAEALAREIHGEYVQEDPIEHAIYEWLDSYEALDGAEMVLTTAEIIKGALGVDATSNQHGMVIRASEFIKKHGWRKTMRRVNGRSVKVWVRDEPIFLFSKDNR